MKHVFTLLWLGFWLAGPGAFAQQSTKVYIAGVAGTTLTTGEKKRRNDEITFQARDQIKNLAELLNTLITDLTESELSPVIKNSYLPNSNQVFYNDAIVVEDDIDPAHTSADNTAELVVDRYLRNLSLFYAKSDTAAIVFSQVVTSAVVDGNGYPYIKVFFKSTFKGKHSQFDRPYQPVQRVAELRGELVDGKWRAFITRLAFLQPGEALTQLAKPVIAKDFGPKQPLNTPLVYFRKSDMPTDSVSVRWDSKWLTIVQSSVEMVPTGSYQRSNSGSSSSNTISISLSKTEQQLTFRRIDGSALDFKRLTVTDPTVLIKRMHRYRVRGWIQVATGILALGASYAGYTSLQNDYKQYTGKLTTLNSEYAIWQTLTQQPAGSQAVPISFNSYASPGLYTVYGGGVVGTGLLVNGIRYLLRAGKIKTQLRNKTPR